MHDTALHGIRVEPDQRPHRKPVYSAEFVEASRKLAAEAHQRELTWWMHRAARARHAINLALRALGDGDAARAERELRRAVER